ncbi:MAG TPA: beta-phosphoglucomutase [Syntrophobacteraceae bacterium]|nr:beta-phosphoglucomutase [Syntrophobacteraceae bacterium]
MTVPTPLQPGKATKSSTSSIRVVVFDCDGVLLDSKAANVRFYNHILARFEQPAVHPDQVEYLHMHSAQESLRFLFADGALFDRAWQYCQGMDFSQFHPYLRTEPGLVPFLRALKSNYHIALATNRTVSTREVLAHFELTPYFECVVTAADVTYPKPHPETMERIFTTFAATPQEVLYIGDSPVDEELARSTDVTFVAYKNPHLEAHLHIDHFLQLYPVLLNAEEQ